MKRIAIIVLTILVAFSSYAQAPGASKRVLDYNSQFGGPAGWKDLYSHFRGIEGVTTVYVSEAMFRLARRVPEIRVEAMGEEDLDLAPIISTLKYLYLINIPSDCQVEVSFRKTASKNQDLREVLERLFNSNSEWGKMEPYLEVNQGKEQVRINARTVGDIVTSFAMFVDEGDDTTLVFIEGEIPQKNLEEALGKVVQ